MLSAGYKALSGAEVLLPDLIIISTFLNLYSMEGFIELSVSDV